VSKVSLLARFFSLAYHKRRINMAKKKSLSSMSVSELQTMIDDQIYRHLPISKLTDIVVQKVDEALNKLKKSERKKA
tara:strand:+ start:153 stop:383 length:231 start_codon:yes stop_codon:yes gene_type:complete